MKKPKSLIERWVKESNLKPFGVREKKKTGGEKRGR